MSGEWGGGGGSEGGGREGRGGDYGVSEEGFLILLLSQLDYNQCASLVTTLRHTGSTSGVASLILA